MAKTKTSDRYLFFGKEGLGGSLVSENAIALNPNQMTDADNVLVGTILSRRKRGGQSPWHTGSFEGTAFYPATGTPIRGFVEYWKTANVDGTPTSDLFLHHGTKVYSIDDRAASAVDRSGTASFDSSAVPSYQVFNQTVYFCSTKTSDGYRKWAGSGNSVPALAPADGPGKYLVSHLGRMVMLGNNTYPFRVYLSSALDADNWSSVAPNNATSLDLDDDGDPEGITGGVSFQNRLYVFTRRSTYEITGSAADDLSVLKVSSGIGAISHASIVQIPNDVIFASDRGVHSLRQLNAGRQTESTFLSRDIQRLWTELINTALFKRITATYDETINSYIVSLPSSGQTTNDQILVYNFEFGVWTKWPDMNARSIGTVLISNKKNVMIGREDGRPILINQEARNDLNAGYTMRFKTGILYLNAMGVMKRFKSITVLASTTTESSFSVNWFIDGEHTGSKTVQLDAGDGLLGSTFILGSSQLGVGQYTPKQISIDDVGYGIRIEFICGGTSDVEIYGFMIEAEDVNERYS